MILTDTVTLDAASVRETRDGYMVADARIARVGIQTYSAGELGITDRDASDQIRVYRSPEEVFATDAMSSMTWRPMTNDHPSEQVTAENWKALSVGMTGDSVARDGDFIRVPLTLMDKAAIRDVKSGKRQLSVGYTCDLVMRDGVTPGGEAYDAVQTNIRGNHLALCHAARGGPALKIGDQSREGPPTMKTLMIDGIPVADVSPAAEAVIVRLQADAKTLTDAAATTATAHAAALATLDAKVATQDAEIATLKTQVLTGDALDKAIQGRTKLIGDAKRIAPDMKCDGLTDAAIKKGAVLAKLGDTYADRAEAFFDAAFELQLANVADDGGHGGDGIRDALIDGAGSPRLPGNVTAYDAMKAELANAWQGDAAKH